MSRTGEELTRSISVVPDADTIFFDGSRTKVSIPLVAPDPIERLTGDVDGNGQTDLQDFLVIVNNFGNEVATWEDGDLTEDGLVSFADFLIFASAFRNAVETPPA